MKTVRKYRLFVRHVPLLYVGGRAGSWGQMVDKRHAWRRTRKWWKANLTPGWEQHYKLQLVGTREVKQ